MKTSPFRISIGGMLAASTLFAQSAGTLVTSNPQVKVRYTVTDLGPVGGPPGQPIIVMNNGLIAGGAAVSSTAWHAMFWYQGTKIDLGKPGLGGSSMGFGANEKGKEVGEAETALPDPGKEDFCGFGTQRQCLPFLWQFGTMTALPLLTDSRGVAGKNGAANSVNNRGAVAGMSENTTLDTTCPAYDPPSGQYQKFQFKPALWQGGVAQELKTVDGDPDGIAFFINDKGQVVGGTGNCTAFQANGNLTYLTGQHATLWQDGNVIDMGSLGSVAPGGGNIALHINNRGQAVGESGTTDGSFHGFLWSKETGMLDIGTVGNDVASVALNNNDNGDIVGISFDQDFNARAFLKPDGGAPTDLNSLVTGATDLYLVDACSINAGGQIIGIGVDKAGNAHGFLATPKY